MDPETIPAKDIADQPVPAGSADHLGESEQTPDGAAAARTTSEPVASRGSTWRFLLLAAVVVLVCYQLGHWASWLVQRRALAAQQQELREELRLLEATVHYDYQCPMGQDGQELLNEDQTPYWPIVYSILGKDLLHDVVYINCSAFTRVGSDTQVPIDRPGVNDQLMVRLTALHKLRWLGLSGGQITDRGLETISQLPELERLWLAGTHVTDDGMVYVGRMLRLERLYLDRTAITDAGLPPLAQLARLRTLLLPAGQITDRGVAHLQTLTGLQELYLSGTRVSDAGLTSLARLTELELFSLRNTRVTDKGLRQLADLRRLRALALDGTRISDAGLPHLRQLSDLEVLVLDQTRVTDAGLAALSELKGLHTLRLAGTRCTLGGAAELLVGQQGRSLDEALATVVAVQRDALGRIISLDPAGVRVTDQCLDIVGQLEDLQWLKLAGTELTDAGVKRLVGLKQLSLLDLSHTQITSAGLEQLAALPRLRTLHLAGTQANQEAIEQLVRNSGHRIRVQLVDLTQLGPISRPQAGGGVSH